MTQEEQATVLARWLSDPPGTPPPSELDPEVVASVYALRPDLAPAAALDLDDLLGSVAAGPLAAPGARAAAVGGAGGEVVPFPASPFLAGARPVARSGARGWARWATVAVGGTSGLGLLVAAAAVLLFVAIPASRDLPGDAEMAPAAGAPALLAEPATAPSAPAAAPAESIAAQTKEERPPRKEDASAPAGEPTAAVPMQRGVVWRDPSTIPELSEVAARAAADGLDAVAAAEEEDAAPTASADEAPRPASSTARVAENRGPATSEGMDRAGDLRGAAVPRDLTATGWRRGVDPATQQVFDVALNEGEVLVRARRYREGGDRLAAAVGAPARAGQFVAARAAAAYLQAGDARSAEAVARRGLALSSENTAERSALLVALGDALQAAGDREGAATAWQAAATANGTR